MKYQTAKFADGIFTITCPHCSNEVAVDETQLGQINAQLAGCYPCPLANCRQEIHFPTAEEAETLKASGNTPSPAAAAPQPAPAPTAAPAPPPQANPAAKPTEPPAEAPTNPSVEAAPAAAEPKPQPASSAAPATDEIVIGFGGGSTATLEREAASMHKLSVKTILRSECVKEKKNFDDEVSIFLSSIDEENLVEVHPVQYTADEKKGNDFGVMILYKIVPEED